MKYILSVVENGAGYFVYIYIYIYMEVIQYVTPPEYVRYMFEHLVAMVSWARLGNRFSIIDKF